MDMGLIGLGKMGMNMAERLLGAGHRIVAYDRSAQTIETAKAKGATAAGDYRAVAGAMKSPRHVWLMIPAGDPVDQAINDLVPLLSKGDTIIDGGNSWYRDTVRRSRALKEQGINYVDCGTSGGIWGLKEGYSMMVGGDKEAVDRMRPIFESLAPAKDRGWGHVGPSGSGHFVKMVHNGVEYGMMQAFAEGFAIMAKKEEFKLDMEQVAEIWKVGSVVRSWLLDLTARALHDNPKLEGVKPWVSDSGEGRWTVIESIDLSVSAPVIALSLMERFRSRDDNSYVDRMLAVMREQFGGHAVKREGKQP